MQIECVIGVIADRTQIGLHWAHAAHDKYVAPIIDGMGALAVLLPACGGRQRVEAVMRCVDGLLFTGSYSNVEPHRYGEGPSAPGTLHDPQRDATTLPLLRAAIEAGVPVLAICRGFQELNVAYGGTLHQAVHAVEGFIDHREKRDASLDEQYGQAHALLIEPGGLLAACARGVLKALETQVNSLHGQGIARLGEGLRVEARAPDGLIEAASVMNAQAFALGVQWHPEWQYDDQPLSQAIFAAFGAACREAREAKEAILAGCAS
ncbi:gamma-glutamyl-gamma-aminobutyrate hydrolase family protein [Burkholderia sp. Ax-1719]|uniref:gamma-glutamyl-gamma-aminobutyrate hydrolase family protein n=1 Tax=Burkholderia sp. Ax-1719 TaxID=2608334 RepID=UPI0014234975|nr:gamma-glutamyl-gamma-aminobutyrate hydrolase family protein [Burkholderia sp. Ax-1719]NIE63535.1 gamma-glutamyl-gamma-aminobutyrate hydrolase family protein [Burkholderia sp. Ax-1719]